MPTDRQLPESLSGLIERVTFFNEANGYAVLKVKVKGQRDLVTIIGSLPNVSAGEWVTAEGQWVRDRDFGLQFRAAQMRSTAPTTREGIVKYLGSGMVKGIGPVFAQKLVDRFGETIFDVIETESARLEEVPGVGPKRRHQIKDAWNEQKVIRSIMVFLHSHGVSTSRAVRIYKTYGNDAIDRVRENPYRLAQDIHGIGFKTADQLAQNLGIPATSVLRAKAGLLHVLLEATGEGHCALPTENLMDSAGQLLEMDPQVLDDGMRQNLADGSVVRETIDGLELVFLPQLQHAEQGIATVVHRLIQSPPAYPPIDVAKAIEWFESNTGTTLAPSQRDALANTLANRLIIITGGPGVGKTTLINAILRIVRAKNVACMLCAPTGRAAKRLAEATGLEARTIHRLLEVIPGKGSFARRESNPLECDLLVVDETSMVDVPLMHHLLRALPLHGNLILVGDVDQLPSVGPGSVLKDLIDSGLVPTVRLTEVFRQAADSQIITNAHAINQGRMPARRTDDRDSDFFMIERETPEDILRTLLQMVQQRIPGRFKVDPVRDIQVLCPMNRGSLGIRELNAQLQAALNPSTPGAPMVERFGWQFRVGDKVIQTQNNYDKDVFNGDIGVVTRMDGGERELVVQYEAREVAYDYGELDELSLAYAITIHKSQGSEFPVVVIPLAMQQYLLLQRNLIYTGITRGKKLVVMIGQAKALGTAVRNHRVQDRHSGLRSRIRGEG